MWQQECTTLLIVFFPGIISHREEQEQGDLVFIPKRTVTGMISITLGKSNAKQVNHGIFNPILFFSISVYKIQNFTPKIPVLIGLD